MNTTIPRTQGAQQQFDLLFQRSRRRAYNLAYRMTGNATEAEDVTQDAYVRAWRHFDNYQDAHSFESWLFRIIVNRIIDLERRKKRRPMCSIDALVLGEERQPHTQEFAAPGSDPEEIVFRSIREERVQAALAALPDTYRQALMMHAVEERSYEEIAETMHCALGTVRSRIHRGRQKIQRTLENRQVLALPRSETTYSRRPSRNLCQADAAA